ncbi:DUF4199 domain-containing protein [Pedobacter panaciterrae]
MKKNILIFGLVLGIILCVNMVYMVNLCYTNPDFKSNEILGYVAMVVVFSFIFLGVRNYRNKQLGGLISFGKAFKTGLLIALAGSTMYVVVWLFYYYLFVPDFLDVYIPHVLKETPASDLAAKTKEMQSFKEMYKNPLFVILITYSEVLPVGLVIALISALVLKRKVINIEANSTL